MRKKTLALFVSGIASLGFIGLASAETVPAEALKQTSDQTTAVISAPDDIQSGRTIILDASASHVTGEKTQYLWSIDETKQTIGRNVEAIFTPEKPGTYTFRLTVKSSDLHGKAQTAEVTHRIIVFSKKIVFIADTSVATDMLMEQGKEAMERGVFIKVIRPLDASSSLNAEDSIVTLLTEQKTTLSNAESIVIWSKSIAGLQALVRTTRMNPDVAAAMRNQTIILIANDGTATLARTTRGAFSTLQPEQIIVTKKEALKTLMTSKNSEEFLGSIRDSGIETMLVNASTFRIWPWDILSILVNYLLSQGVAGQTVILLLMLPVIATIFSFLKQVVGITTFGLYTPSIVALSFLSLGWWIGLLFLLFILLTGYATRSFMKRWRLLYIPKVAIILVVVSLSLLLLVAIGTWFGLSFSRDTVFILLMLSTQAENFLNLKSEEGWLSAILCVTETVSGALLCVLMVQWQALQSLVLAYPELILLAIPVNVFLGRWTGLRFVEYFRFREVFKHIAEEE